MTYDTKKILLQHLEVLSESGFTVGVGFTEDGPAWVHSTYSKNWIDHYVKHNFLAHDPTVSYGMKNTGHFLWSDLRAKFPNAKIFPDAEAFGMPEGNTVSLSINGIRSIASCSGPAWSENKLRYAYAAVSGLHFLFSPEIAPPPITSVSVELLECMVEGLRDEEIAERLGKQKITIRKRRERLYHQTDTKTPPQLVAKAIQNGWI